MTGGRGVLGLSFVGYVPLASKSPYPIVVYSVANYRPHLSHFWANMNTPIFLIHKHSGTFANRKYEEQSYPKKSENLRPHYSQSSRENATSSSGTSPVASYKAVLPPQPWELWPPTLIATFPKIRLEHFQHCRYHCNRDSRVFQNLNRKKGTAKRLIC